MRWLHEGGGGGGGAMYKKGRTPQEEGGYPPSAGPPPPPPLPMFRADSQGFASAPSVPRGFKLHNIQPAFGGVHRGTLRLPPFSYTPGGGGEVRELWDVVCAVLHETSLALTERPMTPGGGRLPVPTGSSNVRDTQRATQHSKRCEECNRQPPARLPLCLGRGLV